MKILLFPKYLEHLNAEKKLIGGGKNGKARPDFGISKTIGE